MFNNLSVWRSELFLLKKHHKFEYLILKIQLFNQNSFLASKFFQIRSNSRRDRKIRENFKLTETRLENRTNRFYLKWTWIWWFNEHFWNVFNLFQIRLWTCSRLRLRRKIKFAWDPESFENSECLKEIHDTLKAQIVKMMSKVLTILMHLTSLKSRLSHKINLSIFNLIVYFQIQLILFSTTQLLVTLGGITNANLACVTIWSFFL